MVFLISRMPHPQNPAALGVQASTHMAAGAACNGMSLCLLAIIAYL